MIWLWRLAANRRVRSQQFLRLLALRGRKCEPSDRVQLGHRAGVISARFLCRTKDLPRPQHGPKFSIVSASRSRSGRGGHCQSIYIVGYQRSSQNQAMWYQACEGNLLARGAAGYGASGPRQRLRHKTSLGQRRMQPAWDRAAFYRATFRPTIVLRSESEQHRFHRWSKKGKINNICFSGHCCELVVDPYFPSL